MKNLKIIVPTFIIAGAVFIGATSYGAFRSYNGTYDAPEVREVVDKEVDKVEKVERIEAEPVVAGQAQTDMTIEQRLDDLERRLSILESK